MKILGIDPGYGRMGIALVERDGNNFLCRYSACIETEKDVPLADRLLAVGNELERLIKKLKPDGVATETLFFSKNEKTAIAVAGVRGAALYIARKTKCTVFEYTPQEVKIAVTSYGRSDKKQVEAMTKRLVKGVREKALDDEYDAIAVAMTALVSRK